MSLADQPFVTATMPVQYTDNPTGILSPEPGIAFRCCMCSHLLGELRPPIGGIQVKCRCGTYNNIAIVASPVVVGSFSDVNVWVVTKWHGEDIEKGLEWQGC